MHPYDALRVLDIMNDNFQNEEKDLSRRAFLQAAATALAAVGIVGCGAPASDAPASENAANNAASPANATANVQKITEKLFSISGGANLKADEALPFVIPTTEEPGVLFRDKSGQLRAMSARCTHSGCVVAWKSETQKMHCPCHNSQFDTVGKVLGGPAKKNLPLWKAESKGNDALISI